MDKYNVDEKAAIITEALSTEEGRMALAQSMANPIQTSLLYQSIARKLLVVDPLPQGAVDLRPVGGAKGRPREEGRA